MQALKQKWFLLLVMAWAFWSDSACFSQKLGKLRLEGQHIERLTLQRKDGHAEQIARPEEIIELPVGDYRLQDVRLEGGFVYNGRSLVYNWLAITEDEPAVLKVGAPLKQTVSIKRRGPVLELRYRLTGAGGETYAVTRSKHPAFTVFKGDKKVGGGEFEFG
jgi:hypothetical protein